MEAGVSVNMAVGGAQLKEVSGRKENSEREGRSMRRPETAFAPQHVVDDPERAVRLGSADDPRLGGGPPEPRRPPHTPIR